MFHCPERYRVQIPERATKPGDPFGAFRIPITYGVRGVALRVVAHCGENDVGLPVWEHVSVSLPDRCPTWDEMCRVKAAFWDPGDCVVQFHPPESDYVNHHPYCLHLWRPRDLEVPLPPQIFV